MSSIDRGHQLSKVTRVGVTTVTADAKQIAPRVRLAIYFFFGSLITIYNPWGKLPPELKFLLFVALQFVAVALVAYSKMFRFSRISIPMMLFAFFYLVGMCRINPVETMDEGYSSIRYFMMGAVTLFTFVSSCLIAQVLSIQLMRRVMIFIFLPVCGQLMMNFDMLSDFSTREDFGVGDFAFDSYQQVSLIFSITAISLLGEFDGARRLRPRNLLIVSVAGVITYFIFNGLARGEAIAFVVAVSLLVSPRLTLLLVPLLAPFYLTILTFTVNSFDTPLTERLQNMLEGDLGYRDVLIQDSVTMLLNDPNLLAIGGGLNAFQSYFQLPSGMYPHNILVEGLITGGVPLLVLMLLIYVLPILKLLFIGLRRALNSNERYALAISVFLVIIMLKSGSLVNMWTLTIFTGVFMQMAAERDGLQGKNPHVRMQFENPLANSA